MALKTANQLRIIAGNLLDEVNSGLNDLRNSTLPQARVEVDGFLDEIQESTDEILGTVQGLVVDLKAIALKRNT